MKKTVEKISYFIKEHYLIISLSFLLTVLIFAPLLAFPWVLGKDYRGININWFGTDAHYYLTRAKEVLDGHNLGSPVVREAKEEADTLLSYSDYILLAPIKLLGLEEKVNLVALYNTYNFIGVFIVIILIYFLVLQLSGRKSLALTAALFTVGGYSIVYNKTLFYDNFNIYARLIYPYSSALLLFLYLNFLVKSLKVDVLKYKIYSAGVFGLMFYAYFYAWSFVLVLNGCLALIYLFRKDYISFKKIFFISLAGLVLGSYNLIKLAGSLLSNSAIDEQITYFIWASYGRQPIFSKIGLAVLILFLVFWRKNKENKNIPLVSAIILAGWIVLNQQIITGRMLQYGHYYWYFITPLSIIIGFYMLGQLIKNEAIKKYLFILAIVAVFVNTAGGQYKSFFMTFKLKKYEQNFRPLIDYLNRDNKPAVIFTDQANGFLFTIYTRHDLFWSNIAAISRLPEQRMKDALYIYYFLNKEARNDFSGYLAKLAADNRARGTYYQILYRNLEGLHSGYDYYAYQKKLVNNDGALVAGREKMISQLTKEYEETVLKDNGINKILKKYGVNYLVWDKNKNPEWDLSGLADLNEATNNNNIYLYSLAGN